jgi:CheY-like chemotaxis protein
MSIQPLAREAPLDILVIEDSKLMRTWTRINLQQAGYEVEDISPTSVFEALEAIYLHRPTLVMTDYEMPGCNGESLIRAIREDPRLRQTAVLVVSSHGEEDLINRLMRYGLVAYLLKPLSAEALVAAVQPFLPNATAD